MHTNQDIHPFQAHNNWELDAVKSGWDAAVDGGARVWWCPNVEDREHCKVEEQFDFIKGLGSRTSDHHPLVSLGMAYDSFGGASAEQVDQRKTMIK